MPKSKKNLSKSVGPCLEENFRINIEKELQDFKLNDDQTGIVFIVFISPMRFDEFFAQFSELSFPPNLTNYERCFVHQIAQKLGLKSKSFGQKEDRHITISKVDQDFVTSFDENKYFSLDMAPESVKMVQHYLEENPLTEPELAAIEDFATTKSRKAKSKNISVSKN